MYFLCIISYGGSCLYSSDWVRQLTPSSICVITQCVLRSVAGVLQGEGLTGEEQFSQINFSQKGSISCCTANCLASRKQAHKNTIILQRIKTPNDVNKLYLCHRILMPSYSLDVNVIPSRANFLQPVPTSAVKLNPQTASSKDLSH